MDFQRKDAMQILNALKNGVVPLKDIELFRISRVKEMEEFSRCFSLVNDGNGIVKFLSGEYGSGKTFLLSLIKQHALDKNFLVSKVQLNKGFKLNRIEDLYYHIMHNLSIKNSCESGTNFEKLFENWIEKLQRDYDKDSASMEINKVISSISKFNSSYGRALLFYIRAKIENNVELSNAVFSWLSGERNIPAALKASFEVKGGVDKLNSMDFLKCFIKLITLIGYNGLIILVDEAELILNEPVNIRKSSYENLRYIIDGTCSGEISNCMFVFAGTRELYENPQRGIREYEALYQRLGNALDKTNSSLCDLRQPIMHLKGFSLNDLQELTNKILSLYKVIYPINIKISNESIRNWVLLILKKAGTDISKMSLRQYIIKLMEVLDIIEQNPDNSLFKSEIRISQIGDTQVFVNAGNK